MHHTNNPSYDSNLVYHVIKVIRVMTPRPERRFSSASAHAQALAAGPARLRIILQRPQTLTVTDGMS